MNLMKDFSIEIFLLNFESSSDASDISKHDDQLMCFIETYSCRYAKYETFNNKTFRKLFWHSFEK